MRAPKVIVGVALIALAAAFTVDVGARGQGAGAGGRMLQPTDYEYTSIDPPGASRSNVFAINSVGALAGRDMVGGVWRGFVFDGTYTDVYYPGSLQTGAYGINTRGDVAGCFMNAAGTWRGFVLSDGIFTEIAPAEATTNLWVYDINDSGTVTGRYTKEGSTARVNFFWRAGTFTEIEIPNVTWAEVQGLNDRGQVAGHFVAENDPTQHMLGFIYDRGDFTRLDWPAPNGMSCLQGIGDTGEAVGHVQLGTVVWGYTYRSGRYTGMLRYSDAVLGDADETYPHGISPSGVIAGYYFIGGIQHGFIATAKR